MSTVKYLKEFTRSKRFVLWIASMGIVSLVIAADAPKCTIDSDEYVGNAQMKFKMTPWIVRGICVRSHNVDEVCYPTLLAVLNNLNELRKSEYSGAAGVLSLLPTIGALLGAPTNEIWTLLSILPFGGGLAMALSFGGAIMPVRVEDYERVMTKRNIAIGSIVTFRTPEGARHGSPEQRLSRLSLLEEKIKTRIEQPKSMMPNKRYLAIGLLGMILLFIGAQAAMIVVEQGGVIPWWCVSRWWMHLWYFLVTLTAVTENWVQLPFVNQYKLYVSNVPYDISLTGGESIVNGIQKAGTEVDNVALSLRQLYTTQAAMVSFRGSTQFTQPRNAVLIMVSVVGSARMGSFWRLLSKSTSIAVFVTGTAIFASVTLLALAMAVMVLTLVLAAGVFGRAIAGWMVNRVSETEPMIHVIVNSQSEAYEAIGRILKLKSEDAGKFQIEIDGHVFVDERRVASRSAWSVWLLGVLADPYDLRLANNGPKSHDNSSTSQTMLLSQPSSIQLSEMPKADSSTSQAS